MATDRRSMKNISTKKIFLSLIIAFVTGCSAANSDKNIVFENIQEYGQALYIATSYSGISKVKAVNKAVSDANAFCEQSNRNMEPVSREYSTSNMFDVVLIFKCI
jgi:hypothetical protein